jgi:peptide/nickel transport system substrate-binding protein
MNPRPEPKETNMRRSHLAIGAALAGLCALLVATLGGGAGAGAQSPLANTAPAKNQKRGGTLNVISAEGWEHLDPGASYFQIDYLVVYATQRPLYSNLPSGKPVPDLAAGPAKISKDGKTVTVQIRPNVRWSPPLNRTITSADVKYAFERDFNPNVQNAYASAYYPIVGASKAKGGPISGITTPNKTTIVFHLTKDFGATFVQSLVLPGSAPVPPELARKYDRKSPSTYDSSPTKQAFSGPYMIKSYNAGRSLTLVRNPNWSAKTDNRPAYADRIVWKAGGDANVAARQTLASSDLLMADTPPASTLKTAFTQKRSQLAITNFGARYATLNTSVPPFDNANLRRAVVAAANRQAYLLARGGAAAGQVASQFLGPEIPGFKQAGGAKGFGFDFLKNPNGDMNVARKYMKLAGYPSGKYTGKAKVTIVGSNADPGPKEMQIVQAGLQSLGFKTTIKAVPQQTMYSKFCGYVKAKVNVCPTAGWLTDFLDPYAYLYVPFSGKAIVPINNSNWAVFDDPKVNAAMDKAAKITDQAARTKAWVAIDRMITAAVPAIPEVFDAQGELKGTKVKGVIAKWNADWDLSWSSVG